MLTTPLLLLCYAGQYQGLQSSSFYKCCSVYRSDLNYLTISRGLTRSKKLERSRPVSSGQHVSKIFTERLFAEGPCSLLLPETTKKIPPKVAPKPRRFVTDIMVSESAHLAHNNNMAHAQYLSLDCLDSTGDYHDSLYSLNSRASSVSGHKSSSSSSSSGHHSRSSTVSSAASIGRRSSL